ncbi:MAG: hypothetical protein CVU71_10020 [Deltaproteobacteria bacterium HGW-Deltaproteobacteria-6]|jgi:long-chain acyl-CoA synthetase|nr:MAG: hypothetical protein CVU71_10020 [Deltaproteobacteria bacterium HGW-Deltaproteobacteria-6]
MLYGEGKDYNVAIIVPNYAELKADPNINSLLKDTLEESLKSKNLQDYLAKGIMAHLRKTFGSYEVPQKFLFVEEDFTIDNGFITQTMKLKRANVLKKYGEQLQALY